MESPEENLEDSGSSHLNHSGIESLADLDWDGLLEVCKIKDEKLNLAGEYGLKLHEQLIDAQTHIDEMRAQHETEIEKYIQESYELKSKLDLKEKTLSSQQQEFESFQKQATTNTECKIEEIRNQYVKEINVMKKDKDAMSSELEQAQLKERHANEKAARLEEKIQEILLENRRKASTTDTSKIDEVFELTEKLCFLEEELEQKNVKVTELQNVNQSLSLELRYKHAESETLKKELDEAEKRCTNYFNHLQQSREETNEIKVELDLLKAELRNSGHLQKGNSLFGEVEDRRAEMEKKLLSMQVKHESLQKAYTFVKSQLHNMKTQVVALLQMNSGRADGERIYNLERALSQAQAETLAISKKLKEAESCQNLSTEGIQALAKTLPHFQSNKDMVNFLSIQLDDYKIKVSKLREELDHTYMVKLAESDKLQTAETKLHETAVLAEQYKNQNMQLRLKLEETKSKLQAETQKRILVEKKFSYDSTGDDAPVGVLSEENVRGKNSLPYTLAKAKEKEREKHVQIQKAQVQQWNSTSTINWKELNLNLPIDRTSNKGKTIDHNVMPSSKQNRVPLVNLQNALNLTTPSDSKRPCLDDRPRKVSFKEEAETIVPVTVIPDESIINEENESLLQTEIVETSVFHGTPLGDTALPLKKPCVAFSPKPAPSNRTDPLVQDNAECNMQ